MDQPFVPRRGRLQALQLVADFFSRYLTPISVAVVIIGVALVIVGPVRAVFRDRPAAEGSGEGTGGTSESGGAQAEVVAETASLSLSSEDNTLDRALVPYTIIPDRPRDRVISYTVRPGDTLFAIADQFGINPNTLFWSNSETLGDNVHMLQNGIELFILPVDGVYHKSDGQHTLQWIADYYQADVNDIINSEYNELSGYTPADIPPWGMRIVVPGGQREIVDWRPPIIETTDQRTGQVVRGFMPGMGGSCAAGIVGSGGTGSWIPPLASYSFTQSYYPGHSGVDLAAPVGTPVLAADSGVVIFSGWVNPDWGYGILVVLDHGNGWTTYYAHLSGTNVGCGQYVPRGGTVGYVGTTGRSSGPHLHFEMRWGHVPDNPANYIGF